VAGTVVGEVVQGRVLVAAAGAGRLVESGELGAAVAEPAAARYVRRARQIAGEQDPLALPLLVRVGQRHGRQQGLCVGVGGSFEDRLGAAQFDDPPEVHHGDPVGDVPYDGQVVGDEEIAQPEPGLEFVQQIEHAGLDGDVQRRDRLVEDHQLGFQRQRAGDADALPLAAGELRRETFCVFGIESHLAQQFGYAGGDPVLGPAVRRQRFGDDVTDRHPGVQSGQGVLEDHLQVAAQCLAVTALEAPDVPAEHGDRPGLPAGQVQDLQKGGGLAAAGLPDQSQGFALADVEADAVHRPDGADLPLEHRALHQREVLDQAVDLQNRRPFLPGHLSHCRRLRRLRYRVDLGGDQGAALGHFVAAVAGGEVAAVVRRVGLRREQLRLGLAAAVHGDGATCLERAAERQVVQRGRVAVDGSEDVLPVVIEPGDRAQQADGVGHARRVVDLVHRTGLDRSARVHHLDPVGESGHHPEVVGDHDDGGAGDLLSGLEDIQDLRLDGDVQSGGRLVGDDHFGVVGNGHRDHRALPHAAGELVREGVHPAGGVGNADHVEQFDGALAGRVLVQVLVDPEGLDYLVAHRVHGGQRGQRVLEDHGDVLAADPGHRPVVQAQQLVPVELYGAAHRGRLGQQAKNRHGRHRLARSRLADDAQYLARPHREGDTAHRADITGLAREGDMQVGDFQSGGELRFCGRLAAAQNGGHVVGPSGDLRFFLALARLELGSRASRSPSPMKAMDRQIRTRQPAGK
jgi:hypothetical protein